MCIVLLVVSTYYPFNICGSLAIFECEYFPCYLFQPESSPKQEVTLTSPSTRPDTFSGYHLKEVALSGF